MSHTTVTQYSNSRHDITFKEKKKEIKSSSSPYYSSKIILEVYRLAILKGDAEIKMQASRKKVHARQWPALLFLYTVGNKC